MDGSIEEGLIDNFNQLAMTSIKQYSMFMEKGTSDADMWNLSQGAKPLRKYITRFKETMVKLLNLSHSTAITIAKIWLWHESCFREELIIHQPPTIQDALYRASNWIIAEDKKISIMKRFKPSKAPPISPAKKWCKIGIHQ